MLVVLAAACGRDARQPTAADAELDTIVDHTFQSQSFRLRIEVEGLGDERSVVQVDYVSPDSFHVTNLIDQLESIVVGDESFIELPEEPGSYLVRPVPAGQAADLTFGRYKELANGSGATRDGNVFRFSASGSGWVDGSSSVVIRTEEGLISQLQARYDHDGRPVTEVVTWSRYDTVPPITRPARVVDKPNGGIPACEGDQAPATGIVACISTGG